MKISEIIVDDVARYLRIDDYTQDEIYPLMLAAKKYIENYTGISADSREEGVKTLDDYEDFYIAFMVLCQDFYDNRSYQVETNSTNRIVDNILFMHSKNLL